MRISRTGNVLMTQNTRLKAWQCTFRKMALVRLPHLAYLLIVLLVVASFLRAWVAMLPSPRTAAPYRLPKLQVLVRTGPRRLHALPLHPVSSPVLQRLLQYLLRQKCEFRAWKVEKCGRLPLGLRGGGQERGEVSRMESIPLPLIPHLLQAH